MLSALAEAIHQHDQVSRKDYTGDGRYMTSKSYIATLHTRYVLRVVYCLAASSVAILLEGIGWKSTANVLSASSTVICGGP